MNDTELLLRMANGLSGSARAVANSLVISEKFARRMLLLLQAEGSAEVVGSTKNTPRSTTKAVVWAITKSGREKAARITYNQDPDGDIAGYDGA